MKPHQGEKQAEKASKIKLGKGEFLVKKKKTNINMSRKNVIYVNNIFSLSLSVLGQPTCFNL